jgi:hypothetical protein
MSGILLYLPDPSQLLKVINRPILYVPSEAVDSLDRHRVSREPQTIPVVQTTSVLSSPALKEGIVKEVERLGDEDNYIPPWANKGTSLVSAFLGLFANNNIIQDSLVRISRLYPYWPNKGECFDLIGHLLSWDYWEGTRSSFPPAEICGVSIHPMPHVYCEAVFHLCARERLGKMWPRLAHALVISYIQCSNDPEGPSFEPTIFPNLYLMDEGTLDGYHPIHRLRLVRPTGDLVLISPGEPKRQALSRLGRGKVRKFVEENWSELKIILEEGLGYKRRRQISERFDFSHVKWLFHRHVLREPLDDIATRFGVSPSTVEAVVRDLRRLLDLQAKTAVKCLDHRRRPQPLHAYK